MSTGASGSGGLRLDDPRLGRYQGRAADLRVRGPDSRGLVAGLVRPAAKVAFARGIGGTGGARSMRRGPVRGSADRRHRNGRHVR